MGMAELKHCKFQVQPTEAHIQAAVRILRVLDVVNRPATPQKLASLLRRRCCVVKLPLPDLAAALLKLSSEIPWDEGMACCLDMPSRNCARCGDSCCGAHIRLCYLCQTTISRRRQRWPAAVVHQRLPGVVTPYSGKRLLSALAAVSEPTQVFEREAASAARHLHCMLKTSPALITLQVLEKYTSWLSCGTTPEALVGALVARNFISAADSASRIAYDFSAFQSLVVPVWFPSEARKLEALDLQALALCVQGEALCPGLQRAAITSLTVVEPSFLSPASQNGAMSPWRLVADLELVGTAEAVCSFKASVERLLLQEIRSPVTVTGMNLHAGMIGKSGCYVKMLSDLLQHDLHVDVPSGTVRALRRSGATCSVISKEQLKETIRCLSGPVFEVRPTEILAQVPMDELLSTENIARMLGKGDGRGKRGIGKTYNIRFQWTHDRICQGWFTLDAFAPSQGQCREYSRSRGSGQTLLGGQCRDLDSILQQCQAHASLLPSILTPHFERMYRAPVRWEQFIRSLREARFRARLARILGVRFRTEANLAIHTTIDNSARQISERSSVSAWKDQRAEDYLRSKHRTRKNKNRRQLAQLTAKERLSTRGKRPGARMRYGGTSDHSALDDSTTVGEVTRPSAEDRNQNTPSQSDSLKGSSRGKGQGQGKVPESSISSLS